MTKLICASCSAAITPTVTEAFLTCEYCGTSVANPYYDAAAAQKAAQPSLPERCLTQLLEMGRAQNLADTDSSCFGEPIHGIDAARAGLAVSDAHEVYFLYQHTFLFLAFSDGLALTDGGVYYKCDAGAGSLSWENFITGAISCVDYADGQEGTLKIGSTVELPVKSEKDSRLARFLVDFHNHVYQLHTGETAPAAWCVTEPAAVREQSTGTTLATGAALLTTLLGTSSTRRQTVLQRTPAMRPTSRPTAAPDRRTHMEPPRPLQSKPHHRPAAPSRPGMQQRPGMQRGPGRPGPGGPGGPGKGRR